MDVDDSATMDVDDSATMDVDAPATLLSLPKEVSDLVLSYLAPGEGGLKSILNLRAVSPTTKGWVDELLPSQRRRILGKCEAEVQLSKESMENFLKNPSPPGVTSLRLKEASDENENREEVDETIWNPFVEFWSPRLESLHLDGSFILKIPNSVLIRLCTSSSLIRSLRCQEIDRFDEDINAFPKFLFQLEALSVRNFGVCAGLNNRGEMDLFDLLSCNKKLKHLEVCAANGSDFLGVIKVINANKDNPKFKLTLGFKEGNIPICPNSLELYQQLVTSIGSSKSSISIVSLSDSQLETVTESVGAAQITKFHEKVETLSEFSPYQSSPLSSFPNVKQIETSRCSHTGGLISFRKLQKLERLGIKGLSNCKAISSWNFLPTSLTHLAFTDLRCSPAELIYMLNIIASNCPRLVSLRIEWTRLSYSLIHANLIPALPIAPFSKLKTFTFKATFTYWTQNGVDVVESCRMVLLDGLCIHKLSLRCFQFTLSAIKAKGKSTFDVLDSKTLTSFIEGPLAASLLVFLVEGGAYLKKVAPLVMKLKSKALSNKMKRRKTHGIRLSVI